MKSVYTVSQVNSYIKNMFLQDFVLNSIYIKGEVSNCKYHSSGHIYFTLKDKGSVISGVMFAGNRKGLKFHMEEGQNVVVLGSVSVYERDGKYQIYAKEIILEGAGLLYQRYEELKRELEEMGLFDEMYKQPIPQYALKIGVCTASTGAAVQDIINISRRRNPYVQLYLYPAIVQGREAVDSIINGLRCLDEMELDVIIVGRGGGSIEDLWAFNEEAVAKAIFNLNTPVISAVGHETDTTIADYVADLRAPTPSAAAELAVFDYYKFEEKLSDTKKTLDRIALRKTEKIRLMLNQYETKMKFLNPKNQIQVRKQYLDDLQEKMKESLKKKITEEKYMLEVRKQYSEEANRKIRKSMDTKLLNSRHNLNIAIEKLNGLSPLNRLSKGFAYVNDEKKNQIKSVEQVSEDQNIELTLADGTIVSKVIKISKGSIFDE